MLYKKTHIAFISIGIVLVLMYVGFSTFRFSGSSKGVTCTHVDVKMLNGSEASMISSADVLNELDKQNIRPVGVLYADINTDIIESELMKNPVIKKVECYKTPFGKVKISIRQREPQFVVMGDKSYYVGDEREIFPLSPNYAAYVPVVSGLVPDSLACGELFDFISFIRDDDFWDAQITQIHVAADNKIELVVRVGDAIVELGTLDNYETKLENLYKLYKKAFDEIGWNRYKKINLAYEKMVICTKADSQ